MAKAKTETAAQTLTRLRAGWKRGGRANTAAQNDARRTNAQRAGRPGRVCCFCLAPVRGGHVERERDRSCGPHGWRWAQRGAELRPAVAPDPELLVDVLAALTSLDPRTARRHKRLIARVSARLDAEQPLV